MHEIDTCADLYHNLQNSNLCEVVRVLFGKEWKRSLVRAFVGIMVNVFMQIHLAKLHINEVMGGVGELSESEDFNNIDMRILATKFRDRSYLVFNIAYIDASDVEYLSGKSLGSW
jgi:hypothetical protein